MRWVTWRAISATPYIEAEEKDLAKSMQESLQESEEEKAKRAAEEDEKKHNDPAAYFDGSSFLQHLVRRCELNR